MDTIQESLNQMMSIFNERLDSIEGQLPKTGTPIPGSLEAEFAEFKTFALASLRALQMQISMLAKQVDSLEMRGRRKILLLHGVPEEQKEETSAVIVKTMTGQLKLAGFSANDISRCHRMGRAAGQDRPRPILFKLRDLSLRGKIWSSKTTLKGSGITLSEFLTKSRHDVFLAARQRFGVSKCWTMDGTVYAIGPDGSRHRLNSIEDIDVVAPKEPGKLAEAKKAEATVASVATRARRAAAAKK